MKNIICLVISEIIIFSIVIFLLVGTIGRLPNNDWYIHTFPNNYYLQRFNKRNIRLVKYNDTSNSMQQVTNGYIVEFTENYQYISLKEIDYEYIDTLNDKELESFLNHYPDSIQEDKIHYYIVNSKRNEIVGPLSKIEYNDYLDKKSIVIKSAFSKTTEY